MSSSGACCLRSVGWLLLLFPSRCLLAVVRRALSVGCGLLFVCRVLVAVCCSLIAECCLMIGPCRLLAVVCCGLCVVCCDVSMRVARCLLSGVRCS